jgi:hypothetical protein
MGTPTANMDPEPLAMTLANMHQGVYYGWVQYSTGSTVQYHLLQYSWTQCKTVQYRQVAAVQLVQPCSTGRYCTVGRGAVP